MNEVVYLIIFAVLFGAEMLYFRIADRFNIIDKPNQRSSHTTITLRGGGIIFSIAAILHFVITGLFPWFTLGLAAIATVSFVDDIKNLSGRIRILVHLAAVSLMFYELNLFATQWWLVVLAYVLVIGTINAYNFMDGINGITGLYSLVFLVSMLRVSQLESFITADFIIYSIIGCVVFLFFNFRKRAKCFAGDVGSVAMAFIVLFLLIKVIMVTGDYKYILFLGLYGVDSVLTIAQRIILKENIFKAHRRHLYQYLTNELKWPHLTVSALYAIIQLVINGWVMYSGAMAVWEFAAVLAVLGLIYIVVKRLIVVGAIKPLT